MLFETIDVSQSLIAKILLFASILVHFLYRECLLYKEERHSESVILRILDFLFFIIPLFQLWNPELGKISTLNHPILNLVGVFLCVAGFLISIIGKHGLGMNWSTGWEYQVKENHKLIKTGAHRFIRHPIYAGIIVGFLGFELALANISTIIVPFLIVPFFYVQARKEEALLLDVFQDDYKDYMKETKMFIPFIF